MQIGTLKLDVPLLLAPMAGITDLLRVICRELGCGMTVSEMVSAKGLPYKMSKLLICCASIRVKDLRRSSFLVLFRQNWLKPQG